jgi:hypothetical protein
MRNPFQGWLQTVGIRDTMARVTSTSRPPRVTRASSETRLDDIAKHIIELLQEDGRQSYAAIAKAVGLSEAAVRQRVQRLLDGGVMQIVAVTDPLHVGFSRQAMIGIRVQGDLRPGRRSGQRDPRGRLRRDDGRKLRPARRGRLRGRRPPARPARSRSARCPASRATETFVYLETQQAALQLGNPMTHLPVRDLGAQLRLPHRHRQALYSEAARDHLWMHFTRHSVFEDRDGGHTVPIIVQG